MCVCVCVCVCVILRLSESEYIPFTTSQEVIKTKSYQSMTEVKSVHNKCTLPQLRCMAGGRVYSQLHQQTTTVYVYMLHRTDSETLTF